MSPALLHDRPLDSDVLTPGPLGLIAGTTRPDAKYVIVVNPLYDVPRRQRQRCPCRAAAGCPVQHHHGRRSPRGGNTWAEGLQPVLQNTRPTMHGNCDRMHNIQQHTPPAPASPPVHIHDGAATATCMVHNVLFDSPRRTTLHDGVKHSTPLARSNRPLLSRSTTQAAKTDFFSAQMEARRLLLRTPCKTRAGAVG